ncbi:CDGSH iron-sulfur domain-containing protein [Nocardioides caeni]|uniref:CDGSH iron-sulfur domain-containing protein n=1 Tax=Nocardioides caeni TaxID=574700 RepID=A0A4S8NMV9_9ACTN|nr:CDGSH iron-sulfur domain-containing protein [Nocardioides caeni]THV18307.1 CDGSH iron-sulfur domain-containing protein [Nocardioides caeni]
MSAPASGSRTGCQITVVPDGPALVRGADVVYDDQGVAHEAERPVVAVCLCGLSQRLPWCDATHKVAGGRPSKT